MNASTEGKEMIAKAIAETTWSGAEQYVLALKRNGFQCWHQLPELFAAYETIERNNRDSYREVSK